MIQINLLPVRARKKQENVRQFISIYLLSVALVICAIGYVWISQNNEFKRLNAHLAQVQQEVAKYAQYEKMLKDMQARKNEIDQKRKVIGDLQKDRDAIVRVLALLSIQVPAQKMWFEKLSESATNISLEGMALSNETIAEFMLNLESSPYIVKGSVNLTHSRQTSYADMKLREFKITYKFLPFSEVEKIMKAQGS